MEKKIKTLLIDDEISSQKILQHLLEKNVPDVEILGVAGSVKEGIDAVNTLKPDLVFLDISMPDGDGFEVLEKVEYRDFSVVFSTAYDEYAIRAFDVSALHYILKPVQAKDLIEAVNRYKATKNDDFDKKLEIFAKVINKEQPSKLILPTSSGLNIIDIEDIMRCESSNNYTTFFMTDKTKIIVSKSIQVYEHLLSQSHFCRLHNKHIVNLKFIKKYVKGRGGYVILTDGSQVDVSEGRKKEFLQKLQNYTLN
jgi:two-component system LytT family response regulator